MSQHIAIYPGSFDPVTVGHENIILRASKLFDKVIVAVLKNDAKTPRFKIEDRIAMLRKTTEDIPNVNVIMWKGMLVDLYKFVDASAIIRGIRSTGELSDEMNMAWINHELLSSAETVFLPSWPYHLHISSTMVKRLENLGMNISELIPDKVSSYALNSCGNFSEEFSYE